MKTIFSNGLLYPGVNFAFDESNYTQAGFNLFRKFFSLMTL
ncbi:hypothetical protein QE436_003475 [Pantoea anthophila]|nr:hypothetical protein [Pantoea anthophila]